MNKTLTELEGFRNRHLNPLPTEKCTISILKNDFEKIGRVQKIYNCKWYPYKKENYEHLHSDLQPSEGYLGTAVINTVHGIGFHAWEQNDSEFIYYQIIE